MKQIEIHQFTSVPVAGQGIHELLMQNTVSGDVEVVHRNGSSPILVIPSDQIGGVVDYLKKLDCRVEIDHKGYAEKLRAELVKLVGASSVNELEQLEGVINRSVNIDPATTEKSLATLRLLKDTAHYAA